MASAISHGFDQSYKFLNSGAELAETVFNAGACIPVVGFLFIKIRWELSSYQALTGLAGAIIGKVGQTIAEHGRCDDELIHCFSVVKDAGKEHFQHGILNMARAIHQAVIGVWTFNLGNLFIPSLRNTFGPAFFNYNKL